VYIPSTHLNTCIVYIPRLACQDKVTLRLLKLYSRVVRDWSCSIFKSRWERTKHL